MTRYLTPQSDETRAHTLSEFAWANAISTLKTELVNIGTSGTREGFKFCERIFAAVLELRNA
jgi:hypothetical protein